MDSPQDFLTKPLPSTTATRIDFANTSIPEYADFYATVIDNALTPEECDTLLQTAQAEERTWERAKIQLVSGRQLQVDQVRKCGRIIWSSHRIWSRVREHVPEIAKIEGQADITGGWSVVKGEVWKMSRLNEMMRFLKYEGGEYFRGSVNVNIERGQS